MAEVALTWCEAVPDPGKWHADTALGRYTVWAASGTCWVHPPGAHRGMPGSPDIPAAKFIAEAHYAEALRIQAYYDAQPGMEQA